MPRAAAMFAVSAFAAVAFAALLLALLLSHLSSRPRRRKPGRKSFERGRRDALAWRPLGPADALQRLASSQVGTLVQTTGPSDERVVLDLRPRMWRACDHAQGVLAGLFECAWATDVTVEHEHARKRGEPCRFIVTRRPVASAPRTLSGAGRRAGAASTRGS